MTKHRSPKRGASKGRRLAAANPDTTSAVLATKLATLESLYAVGRWEDAITLGESILERARSARSRGRVLLRVAMASLRLGRVQPCEQLLTEARPHLANAGEPVMLVECMATEAWLAQIKERPDAIKRAEDALDACRRLSQIPIPLEVEILNALAAANIAAGRWESAIRSYEEAIERTGPFFDMRRQAKLMNEVAIAYHELNRLDDSVLYATRSVALLEKLRDFVSLARSENNLGLTFLAMGDVRSARTHLERSLELCEQTDLEAGRAHVLMSLCELNAAEGKHAQARDFAQQALAYAERLGEASSAAQAHIWLGRVAASLNETDVADSEFQRAIDQLTRAGDTEQLTRCHELFADALERSGELHRAYEHMKAALAYAIGHRPKMPAGDIRLPSPN